MKPSSIVARLSMICFVALGLHAGTGAAAAQREQPVPAGIYRGSSTAVQSDVSRPLRELVPQDAAPGTVAHAPDPYGPWATALNASVADPDPVVQSAAGVLAMPTPRVTFDGPGNLAAVAPPSPSGDVGPNHYVVMSNLYFAIYDKAGTLLYGPAANNTLWQGFGGDCETDNAGSPIVLYDQLADRWLLAQPTFSGSEYFNCVALSTSGDPLATYTRYAFSTGPNYPDVPKYAVWSDAYYIGTREFAGGNYAGIGAYALNRAQMLAGNLSPQVVSFLITSTSAGGAYNIGDGLLPADLDGDTLPPAGSPAYYVGSMDDGGPYGAPQDALTLWKFAVSFSVPANSTFTLASTLPVAAFDSIYPCSPGMRSCIPQPNTTNKLDILSYMQRLSWRLAYRNLGTHESIVGNQSVEAAPNVAGIRWYEVRSPNSGPLVHQQGTYAPGKTDGTHRWMGSVAMDARGDIALGYSASDGVATYPSVRYTGRLAGDPLGQMTQGEGVIVHGTGSQTALQRWGDYTSMTVDPVDDCTFWYVNEYIPVTSAIGWQLRIGAFQFPACQALPVYLPIVLRRE